MPVEKSQPLAGHYEVIAFHGPAGTGKSMRAQGIAAQRHVDLIIDDGLVVCRGQIVAGKSAKTEINMVRAIRRAMFHYPEHRYEVRQCLKDHAPCKIMVLATSAQMARDICDILGLPAPVEELTIDQVASAEEIKIAQHERKHNKRHVIPVGTAQIRKNFTGRLVSTLKSFFTTTEDSEKTIVRPPFSFFGTLNIDPSVPLDIARHVAMTTPQVASVLDVKVKKVEPLRLALSVVLEEGDKPFKTVLTLLKNRIRIAVEGLVGNEVESIDLTVEEVQLSDEQPSPIQ